MSNLSKPSKLSPLEQWQDFCQNLAQSGEAVLTRDSSAREVAEGMRFIWFRIYYGSGIAGPRLTGGYLYGVP